MELLLKYGKSSRQLHIPESDAKVCVLEAGRTSSHSCEADLIRAALATPIESETLSDVVGPGKRVVIVTSDITRPCPSARLLPPLLEELRRGGVRESNITVVFGLGAHRPHTPEERVRLAGEENYRRVRCIDSDPSDVTLIGHTSRGTPLTIFRPVLEADVRVCLGGIEYHYFVGYSGGYKAIVPGVCGIDTIQHHHRMMTAPGAVGGKRIGNPAREDIDEAGRMVGADFILNVIQDGSERVVGAVAGHPLKAHHEGCARLDAFGRATVEQPVDIVVVSAGGYPKDINLYQAQKALESACHIVRPGGTIVLVAECAEGFGHRTFQEWMLTANGPDDIVTRIQQKFVLGGHKAAAVAMAMKQANVYLISALPHEIARASGFQPFDSPNEALGCALAHVSRRASVAVMPEGGSVLAAIG
jgi:nickel-dependent lactate racemase